MKSLSFQQVDVFTAIPVKGNPVAVVLDGDTLSSGEMQSIAAWTNLSETTFVCSPTNQRADYRLRIFAPRRELPFAGHPTIGSAHAVLHRGLKPHTSNRLVQQCGKGLVDINIDGERLLLALPEPQFRQPTESNLAAMADGLGVSAADVQSVAIIDVGPVWLRECFAMLTERSARLLNLTDYGLAVGNPADIVVIDAATPEQANRRDQPASCGL